MDTKKLRQSASCQPVYKICTLITNFQYFGKNQLYLKQLHKYCTEKVAFIGLDYSYHINNNSSFFTHA